MRTSELTPQASDEGPSEQITALKLPAGMLSKWPWLTFLLPMIVYMGVGTLEPKPPETQDQAPTADQAATEEIFSDFEEDEEEKDKPIESIWELPYRYYPHVYTAKIVLTLLSMVIVLPGYRTFPWKVHGISIAVGVVGVVLWIALCHLKLEPKIIGPIDRFLGSFIPGLGEGETPSIGLMSMFGAGERSAFNPLKYLEDTPGWAYAFLAIRFFGLALLVPVVEEFFLRGFVMRYVIHEHWWQVPFGTVNRTAVVAGTLVPMLMHPGELLAAFVWFSMITWLMMRTKNIWDCVVAHAVTNLLLGIYVVVWDQWQLM